MNVKKILIAIALGSLISTSTAFAEKKDIVVQYYGSPIKFETQPVIEDGLTLVPIRAIFEKIGLTVEFDSSDGTVLGKSKEYLVEVKIGDKSARINGKPFIMEIAPKIVNGSTMVPVRFIAEATGKYVEWQPENQSVIIEEYPAELAFQPTMLSIDAAIKLVQETCNCGYANIPKQIDKDPNKIDYKDYSTYAVYEKKDEEGNYIIAIRRKRDTVIQDWVHVNPITKEMKSENGMVDNIPEN
ncbi:stalk domain-containing protein [Paenibacillus periandrae]|uniref:stalk domain-containing protein n=1 Tax=Paenibacillus periandrae TaxID=1761741 RepID=UPI001F09CB83|nr:stalk domain-containing protein [Paenibacillus periandrae]